MQQRFFLYRFFLWLIGVPIFFDFLRIRISQRNSSSDRFLWGVPRLSLLPDREHGGDQHAIKGAAFE